MIKWAKFGLNCFFLLLLLFLYITLSFAKWKKTKLKISYIKLEFHQHYFNTLKNNFYFFFIPNGLFLLCNIRWLNKAVELYSNNNNNNILYILELSQYLMLFLFLLLLLPVFILVKFWSIIFSYFTPSKNKKKNF